MASTGSVVRHVCVMRTPETRYFRRFNYPYDGASMRGLVREANTVRRFGLNFHHLLLRLLCIRNRGENDTWLISLLQWKENIGRMRQRMVKSKRQSIHHVSKYRYITKNCPFPALSNLGASTNPRIRLATRPAKPSQGQAQKLISPATALSASRLSAHTLPLRNRSRLSIAALHFL